MSIQLSYTQVEVCCDCCPGTEDNHESVCPRGALLRHYMEKPIDPKCPGCLKGRVQINIFGSWECLKCRGQFHPVTGDRDEMSTFILTDEKFVRVVKLAKPGRGLFKADMTVLHLTEQIRILKDAKRRALKATRE